MLKEVSPIELKSSGVQEHEFNFFNILSPDESVWDEYHGESPRNVSIEEAIKFASNHWYDWNVRNWGTKWNAYDVYVSDNLDNDKAKDYTLTYEFNTAWSPPDGIIKLMPKFLSSISPNINFNWWYEEEQGWGGIYEGDSDEVMSTEEWDIPNCHADYEKRDQLDRCICSWSDDEEDWYEDCPRSEVEKESNEQQ
jgi:hypothetical protein